MKRTLHWMLAAILVLCGTLASCHKEPVHPENGTVKLQCVKPAYLVAGDTVALISPSYYTPMENVERTTEVLRGWGLSPLIGPNVGKVHQGKYAGTVEERLSDLRWALQRQGVKAIICNHGGYGTIQLINRLSLDELKAHPKWLVGFSDINLPLVMGAPVSLDVRADGATLRFDIEGQQNEVNTSSLNATETSLERRMQCAGKQE